MSVGGGGGSVVGGGLSVGGAGSVVGGGLSVGGRSVGDGVSEGGGAAGLELEAPVVGAVSRGAATPAEGVESSLGSAGVGSFGRFAMGTAVGRPIGGSTVLGWVGDEVVIADGDGRSTLAGGPSWPASNGAAIVESSWAGGSSSDPMTAVATMTAETAPTEAAAVAT